jgi:hypothetical protein
MVQGCENDVEVRLLESVVANTLAAVPTLPHIERTFTSAPRISLVVQSSSGELPSESAD